MTKVRFLANNSWLKRDRTLGMTLLCLSQQDTSTDVQHDLLWSLRDLDLRLNFDLDLSRSNHISFEASLREKHDDAANFYLYKFKSYSWNNISPITSILTKSDICRLNHWPEVTFDENLIKKTSSKAIDWYLLRSSSYHSSWCNGTFSEKYNNNYLTLTFDDLWWP